MSCRRVLVPVKPRRLDTTAAPRLVRSARGRCDQRHRQAGSWRHAGAGERRAARARRSNGRGVSGDARASPATRRGTLGGRVGFHGHPAVRVAEPAGAAGADDCVHDRGHAGLRENGDTRGGNGCAFRARCEPSAHHRSALRGGPRARLRRGCGRSHCRRPGLGVGDRKREPGQRRRTVLDDRRPEAVDDSVCLRSRGRQRGDVVTAACAESHGSARAIAPREPGRRWCHAALRARVDGRDDRASGADGHGHPWRHGKREPGDAQAENSRRISQSRVSRRSHRCGPAVRGGDRVGVRGAVGADVRGARATHRAGTRRCRRHLRRQRSGDTVENTGRNSRVLARHRAGRRSVSDPGGGPRILRGLRSSDRRRACIPRGRPESRCPNGHRQRGVRARVCARCGTRIADRRSPPVCRVIRPPRRASGGSVRRR